MKQRNCSNCGAPLEHSYNHQCKYCGTLYDFNEPEEKTVRLHPYELVDLKYRGVEKDFISNSLLIRFEGYKLEEPKVYEHNGNDFFVSKAINYINPPKSFFFVQIPIEDLEEHGFGLLEHIIRCNIRPSEWENVKKQMLENRYDFYRYARLDWRV